MYRRIFTQARHQSTIRQFLPQMNFTSQTTLGQVFDSMYVKYRYRLVYPIIGWVGVLYYFLWNPYESEDVKKAQLARMKLLKSLEFKQSD